MKTYKGLQSKLARLGALTLIMGLMVSCGSYQNTSYYDNDGVYNSTPRQQRTTQSNADANYYSNYFKQAGEEIQSFTDIDNYTSISDSTNHKPLQAIGYGGWGDETDNVSINIYNNGWGYSPYYNSWYGSPYWGTSISFGFNWGWGGYYSPWYGSSWGYPYYPYYPHYYYPSHRYNNRYVVQSSGQRTGYYNNRAINNSGRSLNQSNRDYNNSSRRVDPNFNSNRGVNNGTNNRESINNRTNTIRSTRDNNNFSRPNNSSRNYNNSSYNNSSRNNTNSTIRTTPSRSNYSSPSPSRGGSYGGSSRMSSGRTGGGRR